MASIPLDQFTGFLRDQIKAFAINLHNQPGEFSLANHSRETWMKAFLNWMEWNTDMHIEYWRENES